MDLHTGMSRLTVLVNTSRHYATDEYEIERLEEMKKIIGELIRQYGKEVSEAELSLYLEGDGGYITPKVDVRAVVFNGQNELLLVKENKEETWSLPGGWADVGFSPREIAEKETLEEAGLIVTGKYLFKVIDKAKHHYPDSLNSVYKLFIYCRGDSYQTTTGIETSDARFFSLKEVMALEHISLARNTLRDLIDSFDFHDQPHKGAQFD